MSTSIVSPGAPITITVPGFGQVIYVAGEAVPAAHARHAPDVARIVDAVPAEAEAPAATDAPATTRKGAKVTADPS